MYILNGVEVISGAYLLECTEEKKVSTYTADHTVTRNQTGHTLVMNSTENKTFTLFTPTAADVGKIFTFANINTGKLTVAAAGDGVTIDGTATSLESDDDKLSTLTLELMSATLWHIYSARGTWAAPE